MCLGIPGRILSVHDDAGLRMATVDFGGVRREVCLEYTPGASVGAYVIVHVGFAITTVDEQEAQRTLDVLRAMGDAVAGELGEPLPAGDDARMRLSRDTALSGPGPTARPEEGRSAP
ncbi:HypC/HybG/HupF family hydrogenase formation chaperone [Streptomyces sp. NPDC053560]|uniref:HypC/HybG/HupF family hydrogenase formation chaperone n=1 Tax=Streptomyces sp. NPDC053560 TaxID=3365711 RepID=UPI0037D97708